MFAHKPHDIDQLDQRDSKQLRKDQVIHGLIQSVRIVFRIVCNGLCEPNDNSQSNSRIEPPKKSNLDIQ